MDGEPKKGAGIERVRAIWRRRKWLGVLAFALPFAAATSLTLSLPSLYRSTATVLVDRQQVPEAFVRSIVTSVLETRLQTISQEILSRARIEGLIGRFGLYSDLRKHMSTEEIVNAMRRDIKLEITSAEVKGRESATIAFALSYRGRDPQTVALVTNTLASFYIEENLKAREQQASGTTEFLKARLTETKNRLDEQERRMSEFKTRHLGELPQQMQANVTTLEMLSSQLRLNSDNQVRALERREALAAQIAEAESQREVSVPGLPATAAPGSEPAGLRLAGLRQELTAAQTRYTDTHPTVRRLKNEIAVVERELAGSRSEGRPESKPDAAAVPQNPYVLRLRDALNAAEAEMRIAKAEERRLRGAISTYQARVENTPRREQEFLEITRDYETTKEMHQSIVKRHEEAQLGESMEQRQKGEQFRILDPAVPSAVQAAPNRARLLMMALALCLGIATGAVMLAEVFDTTFHSVAELREFTSVPVLATIPSIVTEADLRRGRWRFWLAAGGAMLALALVSGTSYFFAHGNEELVRLVDRGRPS